MEISVTGKHEDKQRKATADTGSQAPAPAMPRADIAPQKNNPTAARKGPRPITMNPPQPQRPLPRPPARKSRSTPTAPDHPMTKQTHNG
jgi:hypothetical protein